MADSKISQLVAAATPLTGTELVPLVQSGTNVKGTVADVRNGLQPTLVSGTNVKTVNSASLLGSGDVAVQPTLVSGTNIKSINGSSILASGNLPLVASDNAGITGADAVTNLISMTQAEYDAIGTKSASTLYIIAG